MSCCGVTIEAHRNADLRKTYAPRGRNYTFAGFSPLMQIRDGATVLLTVSLSATANGSVFSVVSDALALTLKKADVLALSTGDGDRLLSYDIVLSQGGIESWFVGGDFVVLDINATTTEGEQNVTVDLDGQSVDVTIMGGNIGIGASVLLADLNSAVESAEQSADDAAASLAAVPGLATTAGAAAGATSGASAGAAAGTTAGTTAANAVVATKVNKTGDTMTGGLTVRGITRTYTPDLPFYFTTGTTNAITGERVSTTFTNATLPNFGKNGEYVSNAGFGTVGYNVGEFLRLDLTTASPNGYARNDLIHVEGVSNDVSFCTYEVNINNFSGYNHGDVLVDLDPFRSGLPWSGGVQVVGVGPNRNSWGFGVCAPIAAGKIYNTGVAVTSGVNQADFFSSSPNSVNAFRSMGAKSGAYIDISGNTGSGIAVYIPNEASISAVNNVGGIAELMRLNAGNALLLGVGADAIALADHTAPTAGSTYDLGAGAPWRRAYFDEVRYTGGEQTIGGSVGTFSANNATPGVGVDSAKLWQTANASATSITALSGGYSGMKTTILVNDANTTFVHSATLVLKGAVNVAVPNGGILNFARFGTQWRETSRSF